MKKLEFGTDGIRGKANVYPLTGEVALKLGVCLAHILKKRRKTPKVIIGRDTRISSDMLEQGLICGLSSSGCDCLKLNILPTPAVPYYILAQKADAGCVISGSHNVYSDNGIKFFGKDGFKLDDKKEKQIEEMINNDNIPWSFPQDENIGRVKELLNAQDAYIEFLKDTTISLSFKNLKIGVDCANGSTYLIVPELLRELQAEVYPINIFPDGININKDCGVLSLNKLKQLVIEKGLDAGFAFDGDGDRVIAVDEKGNVLDGDYILAILAKYFKENNLLKNNVVVTTVMANYGFIEAMEQLGIKVIITQVGDKYVAEKMRNTLAILGGEQAGHIILFEHLPTGDGAITMLKLLSVMKEQDKKLSELAKVMQKYPQVLLNQNINMKYYKKEFPEQVKKKIKEAEEKLGKKGRVVVRYSGTEPVVRIMVEGKDEKLIASLAEDIRSSVEKCLL